MSSVIAFPQRGVNRFPTIETVALPAAWLKEITDDLPLQRPLYKDYAIAPNAWIIRTASSEERTDISTGLSLVLSHSLRTSAYLPDFELKTYEQASTANDQYIFCICALGRAMLDQAVELERLRIGEDANQVLRQLHSPFRF